MTSNHPLIRLRDARCTHPGAERAALDGASLDVMPGERLCVLGANGSGKSTLLMALDAMVALESGSLEVVGAEVDAGRAGASCARDGVALVFQRPDDQMVAGTVADDVAFGPENRAIPRARMTELVEGALRAVGMGELAGADPDSLSGGQRQRVALAGALAMEPRALLLDEATSMLDGRARGDVSRILDGLAERGVAVVQATHDMDAALRADRVAVLDRGRIVLEGAPRDVLARVDELHGLGLDAPFAFELAARLRARGFGLPSTGDAAALARALAPQLSSDAAGPRPPRARPPREPRALLGFDGASFSYADPVPARRTRRIRRPRPDADAPLAVEDLSFSVETGSITALMGPTGAGKTTTAELACALKLPRSGTVHVGPCDTRDIAARRDLRQLVGYACQQPERQLFARTVREDVSFGPANLGVAGDELEGRVRRALRDVGLEPTDELLARSPFALSGGQRRRIALAGILAMDQRVLVLDEPMAGLDPAGRARMRALLLQLRSAGRALLLVTHSPDDAALLADRVVVLDRGRVVADGTPAEVLAGPGGRPGDAARPEPPRALAFARELARLGAPVGSPLTLDALVEEVAARGPVR